MDALTSIISYEIKRQYKSVRKFAQAVDIPQTTISSTLKNGVNGTAYGTVVKICEKLNIELVDYKFPVHADSTALNLLSAYNRLDDKGRHTVNAVLKTEYNRCKTGIEDYDISKIGIYEI